MKQTPIKRRTPLRQVSAKRKFAAITAAIRRQSKPKVGKPLKATKIRPSVRRLRQSRSTSKPTKAEQDRFKAIRALGCIACRMNRQQIRPTATFAQKDLEIHHLLSGGRRIGHLATVCLCHYHHQGKRLPFTHLGYKEQAKLFGPSLEREPRRFRAEYGDNDELLNFQNLLLTASRA